jgi:RNA polymerase sigma-70 factor (ECF subfamily)
MLEHILEIGRGAWPDLVVPAEEHAAYVRARTQPGTDPARLHAADLYLACACVRGDAAAIVAFDRQYLAPLVGIVVRNGIAEVIASEVVQNLRERMFVGRALIADYDGRGPLGAWLRVAAIRAASNARRNSDNRDRLLAEHDSDSKRALPVIDPALALVKRRYGETFSKALADAFAALDAESRNVLRLHFTDGLNLDAIAKILGTSRATAGRRMLAARESVRDETLRLLGERITASPEEIESLLAVVRSTLDISLAALM